MGPSVFVRYSVAMKCVDGRTDPKLWDRSKKQAIKKLGGRFSARAMQLAGKIYRDEGGRYCGSKTKAQRGLMKWTKEDWTTVTGEKACHKTKSGSIRCDRYLPKDAWKRLTPRQVAETRRRKVSSRRQFVPNAPAAKRAGASVRRRRS
jgi:hypothetical protein